MPLVICRRVVRRALAALGSPRPRPVRRSAAAGPILGAKKTAAVLVCTAVGGVGLGALALPHLPPVPETAPRWLSAALTAPQSAGTLPPPPTSLPPVTNPLSGATGREASLSPPDRPAKNIPAPSTGALLLGAIGALALAKRV